MENVLFGARYAGNFATPKVHMIGTSMKVAFVSRWTSRSGAGVFRAEQQLALALMERGAHVGKFGFDDDWSVQDRVYWGDAPVHAEPRTRGVRRLGNVTFLWRKLAAFEPEIIHLHGLWTEASIASYLAARQLQSPLIVSPHGMLDEPRLRYKPLRKMLALRSYEGKVLRAASCIHALTVAEDRSVRNVVENANTVVIPNGATPSARGRSPKGPKGRNTLLYVGRIAALKGLTELVSAWSACQCRAVAKQWKLKIVGYGDPPSFESALTASLRRLAVVDSVEFTGPLYGDELRTAYESADAFILPSHSEGLPMAVLEAWSYGLPVILTEQCNLGVGVDRGAAILATASETGLEDVLAQLFLMPDDARRLMGERGRTLVADEFSWSNISQRFLEMYQRVRR